MSDNGTARSELDRLISEFREHNVRIEHLLAKVVAQREQVGLVVGETANPVCFMCRRARASVGLMVTNERGAAICANCVTECRKVLDRLTKAERK